MIFWTSAEKWEPSQVFCPSCGKKETVWNEIDGGDDYGPSFLCVSCECEFYLPVIDAEPTTDIGYEAEKAKLMSRLRETLRTSKTENGTQIVERVS